MTRINTNVPSLVAQNRLQTSNNDLQTALTRLSTGLRINSGADDPAGLIASEALRSEITGLNKAVSNTKRASQIISTADSALGQVSNLLNDIRGLVVEAANSGALSDDEISANQLQIDSSLEALNRIAQTTTFQGRKLLDGSLDFVSTIGGVASVTDARIDQANLGATGNINVSVNIKSAAERARITSASTAFNAPPPAEVNFEFVNQTGAVTGNAATTASATFSFTNQTGTVETDLDIVADSSIASGTTITFLDSVTDSGGGALAAGDAEASYDVGTNTLTIRGNGDTVTRGDVATAISAVSGFSATAGTAGTAVTFNSATPVDATLTATSPAFTITADTAGAAFDGATIEFVSGGANAATYNSGTKVLTVTVDNSAPQTLADLKTVIDTTAFNATITTGGSLNIATTTVPDGTTSGGGDAVVGDIDIVADSGIEAGTNISFLNSTTDSTGAALAAGAAEAVYDSANNRIVIRGNGDTVTRTAVATAIDGLDGFTATAGTGAAAVLFATNRPADTTLTATAPSLTIAADTNDEAFAGATVRFAAGAANAAAYNATTKVLTVTVDNTAPQSLDAIKALIDATDFTATVDTAGVLDITNTTIADGTTLVGDGGGLNDDVVFELSGSNGSETFNFKAGASLKQVSDAINLVSDATGVKASIVDGALELNSTTYGSDSKIAIDVISEGANGNFTASLTSTRDIGADIIAQVNGTEASGKGNRLSINTATLDLSLSVTEGSDVDFTFDITGGGALFQLGSNVVSNQQARLGIGSVSTGKLGGVSGRLYELGSGQAKSLTSDADGAARIVDEVITKVTSLRGRLGAFQSTTLDSNLVSLNETVANLQEAESSIRDADFAKESANLTRAQILTQSGTNVLSLANQNPQNVLSLLR